MKNRRERGFRSYLLPLPARKFLEDIAKREALKLVKMPITGNIEIYFDRQKAGPHVDFLLDRLKNRSEMIELFLTCGLVMEGPKLLDLSQLDAEALEHTDLSIPFDAYEQPFPTMVVTLPPTYFQDRSAPCEQAGEAKLSLSNQAYGVFPDSHFPLDVTLHHNTEINTILASIYFSSQQTLNLLFSPRSDDGVLGDLIKKGFTKEYIFVETALKEDANEAELNVARAATTIALNAMLTLSGEGMRKVGPEDPERASELQRYIKIAEENKRRQKRIDPERLKNAREELRYMPILYALDQNVVVFDKVTEPRKYVEGEPRWKLEPHWRRGHWQHYWCKVEGEMKRVKKRKKPQFVNFHLYKGAMADACVTYSFKGPLQ
jgi:hypothetical protein